MYAALRRHVTGTDKPIVAAIDFGTTYSGYAYTFRKEYEKSAGAREIFSNKWSPNSGSLMSPKAPTTALFDPQMTFHSFGYEAEEKYADLVQEKQHNEWHCFRRFKMKLHDNMVSDEWHCFRRFKMKLHDKMTLNRTLEIEDEAGRLFPAKVVFTESMRYLKEKVQSTLESQNPMNDEKAIHWVLTIPAIWTEPAKQYMREAAIEAGIPSADLQIALEPEAAAVYCRSLPEDILNDTKDGAVMEAFRPGGTCMIVDMGGGTVDTTVHEVAEDGRLMEIRQASGGAWGGTSVDDIFYGFIVKKFGKEFIDNFRTTRAADWTRLSYEFETQKRKLTYDTNYNIRLQIPQRLITESNLEVNNFTSYDKLAIEHEDFKDFFRPSVNHVVPHIRSIVSEVGKLNIIMLVGGYATSGYVSGMIKKAFSDIRVIVPLRAEVAVMHGAVLFGFEPLVISSRVCRHTYGIRCSENFRKGHHRSEHKLMIDGSPRCINVFSVLAKRGETMKTSEKRVEEYFSTHKEEDRKWTTIEVPVFASTDICPQYTTDKSCLKLGVIQVETPANGWPPEVNYHVTMFFGQTEFNVRVTDDVSGQDYKSSFDFLK